MARVLVAMSGGVDSSVAAALLKEQGHEIAGITMRIWDGHTVFEKNRPSCYGPEDGDIEDVREVCGVLGIPFYTFDLSREYRAEVLDYVQGEYAAGRTPNPCVVCNQKIKLGILLQEASEAGIEFDYVATGHYARVFWDRNRQRYLLSKGEDKAKDQSYFLVNLSQEQLARCLFPLGAYCKADVRRIASELGLGTSDKPESQDFISGSYTSLLGHDKSGPVMDRQGKVLGSHRGISYYTVGQRKGLGIAAGRPVYVLEIDSAANSVIVGAKQELLKHELTCSNVNWIAFPSLTGPIKAAARIRYNHPEASATVTPIGADGAHVKFDEPQMAIAPGQTVAFYEDDLVLGGGVID